MKGKTSTGQEWITKDECELYEYFGKNIDRICQTEPYGYCKYRRLLRAGKWGYCNKYNILIKLVHPKYFKDIDKE